MKYKFTEDGNIKMTPEGKWDTYLIGRLAEKMGGIATYSKITDEQEDDDKNKIYIEINPNALINNLLFPKS